MLRFSLFFLALLAFPFSVTAQERTKAILVLDASGSMWGQIDGVAKITIAQNVVGDLLDKLPAEQELGLTVYGHRVEGNCADIETMVLPGRDTRDAIRSAVNGLSPKGKTPLSDAVLIAADKLSFMENAATVILVTDGVETCDRDPCALARTMEAAGVDFTAHVIGFDVAAVDLPKLQCLAKETGGKFLTANNASELSDALETVSVAPVQPEPEPLPLQKAEPQKLKGQFDARDSNGLIFGALEWTLIGPDGPVVEGYLGNQLVVDLVPGTNYRVIARKPNTGETAEQSFTPQGEGFVFTRGLVFE